MIIDEPTFNGLPYVGGPMWNRKVAESLRRSGVFDRLWEKYAKDYDDLFQRQP